MCAEASAFTDHIHVVLCISCATLVTPWFGVSVLSSELSSALIKANAS